MIKFLRIFFVVVFVLCAGIFSLLLYQFDQSVDYQNPQEKTLIIAKGSSIKSIANLLEEEDIIDNKFVFESYLRLNDKASKLKAGEYTFFEGQKMAQVMDMLVEGKVKYRKFTIPEGHNLKDICRKFSKKNLLSVEECQKEVKNTGLLKNPPDHVKDLEGYLFAETYLYDSQVKPKTLIAEMVDHTYKQFTSERLEKAEQQALSLHEVLTMASVVEKETAVEGERPIIAGVFYNRLKSGMLLQSDPTVIYGIKNYDGNIRKVHLTQETPYNTYVRPGLPIGPICSVGVQAIDAVLNPAETKFLYFVAKGDGSHYFSENLNEHNRAVQYYQLKKGAEPNQDNQPKL